MKKKLVFPLLTAVLLFTGCGSGADTVSGTVAEKEVIQIWTSRRMKWIRS